MSTQASESLYILAICCPWIMVNVFLLANIFLKSEFLVLLALFLYDAATSVFYPGIVQGIYLYLLLVVDHCLEKPVDSFLGAM